MSWRAALRDMADEFGMKYTDLYYTFREVHDALRYRIAFRSIYITSYLYRNRAESPHLVRQKIPLRICFLLLIYFIHTTDEEEFTIRRVARALGSGSGSMTPYSFEHAFLRVLWEMSWPVFCVVTDRQPRH